MPELPEVEGLVAYLRERAVGRVVTAVEVGAINVLKTYDPPPTALAGLAVRAVTRHGKYLALDVEGLQLVIHLARAGWLRWSEPLSQTPVRPGKGPLALRVRTVDPSADDGPAGPVTAGFDLTEAGTQKRLAVWIVRSVDRVPGLATLGPDPLADGFDRQQLAQLLTGANRHLKGLLRDQRVLAGVGNAYSDEVLHVARLSPFALAASLDDAAVDRLFTALREVLTGAVAAASGKPAQELKDAKRAGMRVHGRTGQPCPACGDRVREVSFADSSLQYCATCQTAGKPLADRRLSRLLR